LEYCFHSLYPCGNPGNSGGNQIVSKSVKRLTRKYTPDYIIVKTTDAEVPARVDGGGALDQVGTMVPEATEVEQVEVVSVH